MSETGAAGPRCRLCRMVTRVGGIPALVHRLARTRGIRKALSCLGSELYSQREYVVTYRDLRLPARTVPPDVTITLAEVTRARTQDVEELCRIWPAEFGYWRPEHLKRKILRDLEQGNWCFCARANGNVIGAVWVLNEDAMLKACPVRHLPGERIVGRASIVPPARGTGLSKWLYNHAVKVAAERGVPQLFAFTFPCRVASIRAKLSVDFQTVGTVTVTTRWGKSAYRFTPVAEAGTATGSGTSPTDVCR